MWAFYRREIDQCAAKLCCLHDTSASSRHQLHRKAGGSEPTDGIVNRGSPSPPPMASLLGDAEVQYSPSISRSGILRPNLQVGAKNGVFFVVLETIFLECDVLVFAAMKGL